jgi:hypothetical protein
MEKEKENIRPDPGGCVYISALEDRQHTRINRAEAVLLIDKNYQIFLPCPAVVSPEPHISELYPVLLH